MATEGQKFAPQTQPTQPGKQHIMGPPLSSQAFNTSPQISFSASDSKIGRAMCHCFTLEGATVALTYVKKEEEKDAHDTLQMLLESQAADAKRPIAVAPDLGFNEDFKRVVEVVVAAYGRIDILVNTAAELHKVEFMEEIDEQTLERVFRTNIFSQFFIASFNEHPVTSVVAYKGCPQWLDYTATKGAIVAFTRSLALQLVSRGIRVNGVAPGSIWTPLIPASFDEEEVESFGFGVPMKRARQPVLVAPSYVFLACNHYYSYFTGQILHPNGGTIVNG